MTRRLTAWSSLSRRCRQASSPRFASCSVEATMSVNSTVASTRSDATRASGSARNRSISANTGVVSPKNRSDSEPGSSTKRALGIKLCRRAVRFDVPVLVVATVQHQRRCPHAAQKGLDVGLRRPTPLGGRFWVRRPSGASHHRCSTGSWATRGLSARKLAAWPACGRPPCAVLSSSRASPDTTSGDEKGPVNAPSQEQLPREPARLHSSTGSTKLTRSDPVASITARESAAPDSILLDGSMVGNGSDAPVPRMS